MKNYLIILSLLTIGGSSLVAKDVTISDNIVKYNQMKEDNYLAKLIRERELLLTNRDSRVDIREYKNAKTYCNISSQNRYACQ